jgi:hypothetical protein
MSESKIKLSSPLNLRIYRITSFIATPTRFSFPPLHRPWHPSLPRVQDSKLKTQHRERRWFGKTAPNNALPRSRCVRPGWRACHRDDLTDREQPRSPGPPNAHADFDFRTEILLLASLPSSHLVEKKGKEIPRGCSCHPASVAAPGPK